MSAMYIDNVEKRQNEVVYWIGEEYQKEIEYGFVFKGPIHNIARQGIVESYLLALMVMGRELEKENT